MLIKVYYCELRPVVIILPVYISLDESTSPNDVKPAASGKLVNGQWVSTAAQFFDPHISASLSATRTTMDALGNAVGTEG